MSDEYIKDGDIVVVVPRDKVENGQTVLAVIDGNYAVLKRFYREPDCVRLESANPEFKPLLIKPERLDIQGVVKGVIRKYED